MVPPSPPRQIPGYYLKEGHGGFLPSPYQPIIIPNNFARFLKWCAISVMDIALSHNLRKHFTYIIHDNKNNFKR
jgi:hypothetical protein